MSNTISHKIRIRFSLFRQQATIKLLYLFCRLLRRKLKLLFLSQPDPLIIGGNYFVLNWKATGCYKIIINKTICLPGNTTQVYFDSTRSTKKITLQFFGYRQYLKKTIPLKFTETGLKKNITPHYLCNFSLLLLNRPFHKVDLTLRALPLSFTTTLPASPVISLTPVLCSLSSFQPKRIALDPLKFPTS